MPCSAVPTGGPNCSPKRETRFVFVLESRSYEGRGEFQLVCEHIEAAGAGALQIAFEQLKARLSEEGLFASEHKQSIPNDAEHVGIVTSATGAALQDVLTILERRSPHTRVYVFPVPVQGDGAAQRIADAINQADQLVKRRQGSSRRFNCGTGWRIARRPLGIQ